MTPDKPDLTVITTHLNADFDALASMLAASLLYPGAVTAFPGSQEKGLKEFFVQSVSYMLDLKKPKDVDLDRVARLVLVDTRQRGRIGRFAELLDMKRPAGRELEIHVYDHHPASGEDIRGQVEVVEEIGSCTTLMCRLLKRKKISLNADQATLLALGIYEDTGCFTFSSTTPDDMLMAAEMVHAGANLNTIASLVVRDLDSRQVALLNDLLTHLEQLRIGGVEVALATCSTDTYSPDFAVVAHKLMEMENLRVFFALARMEDRIHLVARSRQDDVDVGRIAAAFGGGGHASAASATIKDRTLVEVRQQILSALEAGISPKRTAQEIMSFPVLSVAQDAPVSQAHEMLTRYNINALPVMDGEKLAGLINRQVVEKAIFLGLGNLPLAEYMNPEIVTIPPQATLVEIQEKIVGQRQRLLPVVGDGKVMGVVTRTDLLNILMDEPAAETIYAADTTGFGPQKNLAHLIQERLPQKIVDLLRDLGRVADDLGFNVFAVGGFVRDILLRRENLDLDVVVEGDGVLFAQTFGRRHGVKVRTHLKFGTAVLIFKDGLKVDVATARLEYYESPAALPVVELSSLKLDLYRRDFTINTLSIKLNPDQFGVLVDYFSAQRDLKEKTIRVLHSLSLVEDPTRALRAIRFEQRFGFRIGRLTVNLIKNAVRINAFARTNPTRLLGEIVHILDEANPVPCLRRMQEFEILGAIHSGLRFDDDAENLLHQAHLVLNWFGMLYLDAPILRWVVYFLVLAEPLTDAELTGLADQLAIPDRPRRLILEGRPQVRRILAQMHSRPNMRPSTLFALLKPAPTEALLFAMAKGEPERIRRSFSLFFTDLLKVEPLIDGHVLKQMGFKPGPDFKTILEAVLKARLNRQVRTLQDEKAFVQAKFGRRPRTRRP